MRLIKKEVKLSNGFNQFNLVNENNLIVGVVAGFTNHQNRKNATLFENAPEMLDSLNECYNLLREHGIKNGSVADRCLKLINKIENV